MFLKYYKYLVLVICLTGCKKCRDCKQSEIQGDIVSLYNNSYCFNGGTTGEEYHIRDTASLIKLLKTYNCDTNSMVNIDFSKHVLLGKYMQGGGCSVKYIRNVVIDNQEMSVKYSIYSCTKGTCQKLIGSHNFVIVPKFPSNYSLSFETKKY